MVVNFLTQLINISIEKHRAHMAKSAYFYFLNSFVSKSCTGLQPVVAVICT